MSGTERRPAQDDRSTSRAEPSRLTRLSPSLWWYRDTCNVFLWVEGERGLLIDFGSGAILDSLTPTGVREIVAIAHTHHHRDQCGGDDRAAELGIPIWVPAREQALFESTEAFWRMRRTYDSYEASSLGFTRATSIVVARGLADHERLTWAGGPIEVVPTPGHTKGSISLVATIDGTSVAFTGDLISGHGRVPTLHDLQWQYGMPDAVGAALHSTTALAGRGLQRLLPSHGAPIDDGSSALRDLAGNLRQLARLLSEIRRNRLWTTWPSSVDQPLAHPLPHLWVNAHSVANTYALIDAAGEALILDYGFPSWDHLYADQRFVAHTLDAFRTDAGLARVRAAIPSHYHDDHLAGVPWLQREQGAEAWIHQSFAEIVAEPARYDLPCLWADPIRVDRVLTDGDVVEHAGARLETFHMPGHTMFALGLAGTIDGVRVAYLNISAMGQIDPAFGELHDLRFVDPERAAAVARANADLIVGFKVRISEQLAGPNGLAGLDRALEAGQATGLPVMVHIGGTAFDIEEALDRLRPNDIVTHAYTGWRPGGIVTDAGRIVSAAREARSRGVRFDVGHGAGSFTWPIAEAAMADGFRPDTISSDLHRFNVAGPVHDLATTLSKFLLLDLSLDEVIAMATTAPAAALGCGAGITGIGTLAVGAEADVSILRLEDGRFDLTDSAGSTREGRQRLVPVMVLRSGRQRPILPLAITPPAGISPG